MLTPCRRDDRSLERLPGHERKVLESLSAKIIKMKDRPVCIQVIRGCGDEEVEVEVRDETKAM